MAAAQVGSSRLDQRVLPGFFSSHVEQRFEKGRSHENPPLLMMSEKKIPEGNLGGLRGRETAFGFSLSLVVLQCFRRTVRGQFLPQLRK